MKVPPRDNAVQRLAALNEYEVPDTQTETALNKITRLAADICGTPIAFVNLINAHNQRLKSKLSPRATKAPLFKGIAKLGLASAMVAGVGFGNYRALASFSAAANWEIPQETHYSYLPTPVNLKLKTVPALLGKISTEDHTSLIQPAIATTSLVQNPIWSLSGGILLNFGIFSAVYSWVYRQLTTRKRLQAIIEEERNFSSAILDTVDALVIVLDHQGRIVRFNRAYEQTTGYAFKEVKGKFFWDFLIIPEEIEQVQAAFVGLQPSDFPNQYENYCQTNNGNRLLISWSNTALLDSTGEINYIISTGIDVTERQESQEQLLTTTSRLTTLIANLQAGILVEDECQKIVLINQEFCNMFGIAEPPHSFLGGDSERSAVAGTKPMAEPEKFVQRVAQILAERRVVTCEEIVLANGQIFERDYIPIFIADKYRGHLWQYRDITARKSSEKALKQQVMAVESAMDGIAILNQDSQFIYLNDAHLQLFGYDNSAELIGKTWQELYYPDEIQRFEQEVLPQLQKTGRWRGKATAKRKDGTTFAEEVSLTLIPNMGLICVCRDITERVKAEEALKLANTQLTNWVSELEGRNREITMLGQMSEVLQACLTLEEAYTAIPSLVQPLFPHLSGGIFLFNQSQEFMEAVATWGTTYDSTQAVFPPHDCWALRRCRTHLVSNNYSRLRCKHVNQDATESMCIPLMAQGKALGVLHVTTKKGQRLPDSQQYLAATVAEHIALALGNLKLREKLQHQSIRDPLTGLFNRRYMEESLSKELQRVSRQQQTLSIVMLDVDYFKRFNDTYGHEAGDLVLRELGAFLQANVRGSDIACRYGGEELTLILPEATLEDAFKRAEQLTEGAKQIQLHYRQQYLDKITLSAGVASCPQNALTADALVRSADTALYAAKALGRDRVVAASSIPSVA
jgi:diguanylate cyclase (GGDEF)-like protein/PAS domain S-box-containing protein